MSHSLKKIQRRGGVDNIKCAKSKRKQASRAENTRPNRKKKAPRGDDAADVEMGEGGKPARTDVAKRAEARTQLGKQSRQDEFAKRRGLATPGILSAAAGYGTGLGDDATPHDALAASTVAERALSSAPRNQKTFMKELARVLKESDVLLEVLDARDPLGCRCTPLEDAVIGRMTSKRIVLILNKIDLIPAENATRWLTYLRQYFPTVPFKAQGASSGRGGSMNSASHGGSEAFGGEQLLQLLKNYSRSAGIKTAITVGVVGYPNVGKSSLINALKRSRAVTVGATPGVTTTAQIVSIDKRVKLMDCPGIVFARARSSEEEATVLLRNCVKVEKMVDLTLPIEAILKRVPHEQLRDHFQIARFAGGDEFLTLVALKRGKLGKGGAPDRDGAARAVLQDWNGGSIAYFSEVPKQEAKVRKPMLSFRFIFVLAMRTRRGSSLLPHTPALSLISITVLLSASYRVSSFIWATAHVSTGRPSPALGGGGPCTRSASGGAADAWARHTYINMYIYIYIYYLAPHECDE